MGEDLEQLPGFLTKIYQLIGGFSFLFLRKHFKILKKFSFKKFKYGYLLKRNNYNLIKKKNIFFLLSLSSRSKKKYNKFIKRNKFIFFRNYLKILKNKNKNKKIDKKKSNKITAYYMLSF